MNNKLNIKKLYIPALVLALLLVSSLLYRNSVYMPLAFSHDNPFPIPPILSSKSQVAPDAGSALMQIFPIPQNAVVLQRANQDLYGDKKEENIVFYMQNDENGYPMALHLLVDGAEKVSNNLIEGYTVGRLQFEDLDHDGTMEVLVYQCCTGSSGAALLNIYKPSLNNWKLIFSAPQIPFGQNLDSLYSMKYLGDYRVRFIDKRSGLKAVISLTPQNYPEGEDELKTITTWVDPIRIYIIKDVQGDTCQEIVTVQVVCGICHADLIAELNTTYKMINGEYQPVTQSLTAPGEMNGEGQVLTEIKL